MPGTSTNRSGPSIRQPLRHLVHRPHHHEHADRSIEDTGNDNDGIAFRQEPTEDGEGVILEDEQVIHHHLGLGSALSKFPSSTGGSSNFTPQHDKDGKPIKSHGPETFGDIMLHPIKQLELHRRRQSVFEHEKQEWNDKHSSHQHETASHLTPIANKTANLDSATTNTQNETIDPSTAMQSSSTAVDEEAPPAPSKPRVKIVIHFKHLMGEQALRIFKPVVDQLIDPLSLTGDEVLQLYKIKDTDELVEFFHYTKRDYSLKIHKTVNLNQKKEDIRAEIDEKKQHIEERTRFKFKDHGTGADPAKLSDSLTNMILPKNSVELNDNVFLELRYIEDEPEPEHESTRRPIFALPDPDLSDEIGEETSATWVELFSDVFYVGWLSSFTHSHHMVGSSSLATYVGWFVVMWWTWCSSALYSARYDNGDVMHHIYKIIDLCGLIGMAGASEGYDTGSSKGFIIGYMVMKAVLLIQYSVVLWGATLSGSFARRPLSFYVAVNVLAIILWGVSLLYLGNEDQGVSDRNRVIRMVLWYISIGVEVLVNMSLQRFKQVSLAASHLAERFGLFTIIILGENCIGFIKMVSESHAEVRVVVANMFGLVIIFLFFFMYFDDFSKEILNSVQVSQIWMYLHFPLHLCQVAFGIAMTDIITAYRLNFDIPDKAATTLYHYCESLKESGGETTPVHAALTTVESFTKSLISMAAASAESDGVPSDVAAACEEIGQSDDSLDYVFKAFWISGGLILCLNALIKLVNTPVRAKWSRLICGSRFLNAIVFFGLSEATFGNFNGLGMLGIMMACLLLQSSIDLLD
ncbi:bacterial low temperature requirement A protein-domain-containing protein [Absidia repens]|uniref:Bacterial low temperature requirement A protein-domain-containing protein n=1 Tax=Absidia repens TaxID=90262 RepID=A0A1X2INJ1_9FUNG|nr:bacterial low temperature requirement A protein-domain-containing protein [Absidia repens]